MNVDANHFTIIRSQWTRGKGPNTKLLDEKKNKDCLGFFMKASGFKDSQILNLDEPIDVINTTEWHTKLLDWHGLICMKTDICCQIISINDSKKIGDSYRERRLTELFEAIDVKVDFVDEPSRS